MADSVERPITVATWTNVYRGAEMRFRLRRINEATSRYIVEAKASGSTYGWSTFLDVDAATPDRAQTKLTPKTLVALFDVAFRR